MARPRLTEAQRAHLSVAYAQLKQADFELNEAEVNAKIAVAHSRSVMLRGFVDDIAATRINLGPLLRSARKLLGVAEPGEK